MRVKNDNSDCVNDILGRDRIVVESTSTTYICINQFHGIKVVADLNEGVPGVIRHMVLKLL